MNPPATSSLDTEDLATLGSISSVINYVETNGDGAVRFKSGLNSSSAAPLPTQVRIYNARERKTAPALAREGFTLCRHDLPWVDFTDPAVIRSTWVPAVKELIKDATGAPHVIAWASNVRFSERSDQSTTRPNAGPARRVHSDHALDFDPMGLPLPEFADQLHQILEETGADRPARIQCLNVWQPISEPPHDTPLALCDATSMSREDMVVSRLSIPGGLEVDYVLYRPNQNHRWFYFRDMEPTEALVFYGMDPAGGPTRRAVAHTAFDDPTCPPDTAPRTSVEVRAVAIFDD